MMTEIDADGVQVEEPSVFSDDGRDASGSPIGVAAEFGPLRPENVRWFYKSDSKRWTKFDGFDSLSIEHRYRVNFGNEEEVSCLNGKYDGLNGVHTVVVRGGLYEVDLLKKKCTSIFWPGEYLPKYFFAPQIFRESYNWYQFLNRRRE